MVSHWHSLASRPGALGRLAQPGARLAASALVLYARLPDGKSESTAHDASPQKNLPSCVCLRRLILKALYKLPCATHLRALCQQHLSKFFLLGTKCRVIRSHQTGGHWAVSKSHKCSNLRQTLQGVFISISNKLSGPLECHDLPSVLGTVLSTEQHCTGAF